MLAAVLVNLLKFFKGIVMSVLVVTQQLYNILAEIDIVRGAANEHAKVANLGWVISLAITVEGFLKVEFAIFSSMLDYIGSLVLWLLLRIGIEKV